MCARLHANLTEFSLRKIIRVSLILVTVKSRSDSDFERSNISFKENNLDGVDLSYNVLDYCARKNKGKFYVFWQTDLLF